jgi:predicted GIY-YIG superfamily endonuclease
MSSQTFELDPTTGTVIGSVYLLHFDTPFGHAKHYTGWARDLEARLEHHAKGSGARLTQVVAAAGIGWSLARTWTNVDRYFERRQKARGAARHCPICQGRLTPAQTRHYGPLPGPIAALAA